MEELDNTNWEDNLRLFDIKLINVSDFFELVVRLALTIFIVFLVTNYYKKHKDQQTAFYFSYFAVSIVVFLLCFLLNSVKLQLGFALGLFAIFGIIRYRTDAIPIREMTYLFIVIGISVMNALATKKVSYAELLLTNAVVVGATAILEKRLSKRTERSLVITYEVIENIHVTQQSILLDDLRKRTGIEIKRFQISKIDFLKDTAQIKIWFDE